MATTHIEYCRAGSLDRFLEHCEADYLENGISKLCLTRLETTLTDNEMATLCVDIVKEWLKAFSYIREDANGVVHLVSGLDASGIDGKYIKTQHWFDLLQSQNSPHKELNNLFENDGYRGSDVDIASHIPDHPVERFVLHFIYDWGSKFKIFFQDREVSNEKKIAVLKKQLENIVYYGQRRLKGSTWHMYSSPNDILRQALTGQGATVNIVDSMGPQLKTIQGHNFTASADPTISPGEADGPKPDQVDQRLHKDVLEFAKSKKLKNLKNWTMVKASFDYKDDAGENINIRCYAFSGVTPEKISLPLEWWKSSPKRFDDFYFKEGRKILLAKGGEERLGQNMVMSIFNALHTFYKEDLRKLTEFIAFEDYSSAEAMIQSNRNDLVTLHYGEYYDEVVGKINKCDKSIMTAVENVFNAHQETINSRTVKVMVTCGSLNKQYKPDINGLKGKIDDLKLLGIVENISTTKLSALEIDLKSLPDKHLDKMRTVLGRARCGEDNVLPLLLAEMLKRVKVFLSTRVTFVALDAEHPNGKPFCFTCGKKVRIFSILPSVLRFLGATGRDECKYLEDLFASLQNQGS